MHEPSGCGLHVAGRDRAWGGHGIGKRVLAGLSGLLTLMSLAIAPPVAAQTVVSVHLEIEGGPYPGTYDLTSEVLCYVFGEGTWIVQVDDPAQIPGYVSLEVGGAAPRLSVAGWAQGGGYTFFELEHAVDERDGDATLTVTADEETAGDGAPASIRMDVECDGIDDGRMAVVTPEPTIGPPPTPQVQGPPPEGSTVIDIALDFGPWAGRYAAWTLEDACSVSEGAWMVTFYDRMAIPSSVSLIGAEADGDEPAIGLLTATFGALPDMTRYDSSDDAAVELAADGRATLSDPRAVAILPDGTQAEGALEATIECARVSS